MLRQRIVIPEYDWEVNVYYHISCYNVEEIVEGLRDIGCPNHFVDDARRNMAANKLNTGLTYSSIRNRQSIMVISDTSSPAQFMNSYDHERYHLVSHIEDAFGIDPASEEAAYLAGHIGQLMYPKARLFMCECHRHGVD